MQLRSEAGATAGASVDDVGEVLEAVDELVGGTVVVTVSTTASGASEPHEPRASSGTSRTVISTRERPPLPTVIP